MFGKRTDGTSQGQAPALPPPPGAGVGAQPAAAKAGFVPDTHVGQAQARTSGAAAQPAKLPAEPDHSKRSDNYYDIKSTIFNALIDAIDLTQLAQLDRDAARDEIRDIVNEIIALKDVVMSIAEQEELLEDICNDVLGYGPLEPLLARDDIADIMVNGASTVFIEVNGKMQKTGVRFRDNAQLLNICQRIVSQVGRRVDEASPICDARLPDGSRVNVIAPPLAIDGCALTIRKFKKDRLRLPDLVRALKRIQSGEYAKMFISEGRTNYPSMTARRRLTAEHSIEKVGSQLRAMMPWIAKNKLVDQTRN